jgi:hypothetical protein
MTSLDNSPGRESQRYHHFSSKSFCKWHLRCSSNKRRRIFGWDMIVVGRLLGIGLNCMRTLLKGIHWLNRCVTRSQQIQGYILLILSWNSGIHSGTTTIQRVFPTGMKWENDWNASEFWMIRFETFPQRIADLGPSGFMGVGGFWFAPMTQRWMIIWFTMEGTAGLSMIDSHLSHCWVVWQRNCSVKIAIASILSAGCLVQVNGRS